MIQRMTDLQFAQLTDTYERNIAKEYEWKKAHLGEVYQLSDEENRVYFDWREQNVLRFEPEHMQADKLATIAIIRARAGV